MRWLARLVGRGGAHGQADDTVPWVWSARKVTVHLPECPRVLLILPENRRASGQPAEVRRACRRGCRVCGSRLPNAPVGPRDVVIEGTVSALEVRR